MVVRSGDESIVRFDRERIRGYRIGGFLLFLSASTLLVIALDEAAGQSHWGRRIGILAYYAWCVVPAAFIALKTYKAGWAFSQGFVAVGPDGVRLHLLRKKGFTYVPLQEQRFKWEEIMDITCDGRFCRFRAGGHVYTLSDVNSPSPLTVAQMMAEKKGVQLPAQEWLAGKKPMPRLKQAAISGGIGFPLIGMVAAGGWWLYINAPGSYEWPYYTTEFLLLLVLGTLGFTLSATAIVLILVEVNHRL